MMMDDEDIHIPSSRKRQSSIEGGGGAHDNDDDRFNSSLKKRRMTIMQEQPHENFIPTTSQPSASRMNHHCYANKKFLMIHLAMLRAAYHYGPTSTDGQEEDGKVQSELWMIITKFLRQRDEIQSMLNQVQSCQGMHDEAVKFIHVEEQEVAQEHENQSRTGGLVMLSSSGGASISQNQNQQLLQSPVMIGGGGIRSSSAMTTNSTTPNRRFASSLLSATQEGIGDDDERATFNNRRYNHSHNQHHQESSDSTSSSSFGLIATLLKQKYDTAHEILKQQTTSYNQLVQDVRQRIKGLEKLQTKYTKIPSTLNNKESFKQFLSESSAKNPNYANDEVPDEEETHLTGSTTTVSGAQHSSSNHDDKNKFVLKAEFRNLLLSRSRRRQTTTTTTITEKHETTTNNNKEELLARLNTKLNLWILLLNDLEKTTS